jgi:hypothetical protein
MGKNDKRMCWSCDGHVSFEHATCPYCSADLGTSKATFSSEDGVLNPPYPGKEYTISTEEWESAFKTESTQEKTEASQKNEMMGLLLLIPGVVFVLFALLLFLFSKDGVLEFSWNESFAYFYFIGALPLLFFGYKSLS